MARYRVLIVDDQWDIRRVLSAGLTSLPLKIEVVDVPSAEEAMLVAAHGMFDLMVSDVRLPGISGLDLVRRVQRLHPAMKVMLMTGMTDPTTRSQVEAAGAVAFFYKPVDLDQFMDAVRRTLGAAASVEVVSPARTTPEPAIQEKPLAVLDRLETIRRKAVAGLAAVLDVQGKIIAQAGFLNGVFERPGLAAALANLYASGVAVSQQLGRADLDNLFYLAGKEHHFYLASINPGHVFVLTAEQPFQQKIGDLNHWLPGEVRELERLLAGASPLRPPAEVETTVVPPKVELAEEDTLRSLEEELANVQVSAEDQAEVDALFNQASKQEIQGQALDDFWDTLAEETGSLNVGDGSLTYDQARDMGLAPE